MAGRKAPRKIFPSPHLRIIFLSKAVLYVHVDFSRPPIPERRDKSINHAFQCITLPYFMQRVMNMAGPIGVQAKEEAVRRLCTFRGLYRLFGKRRGPVLTG